MPTTPIGSRTTSPAYDMTAYMYTHDLRPGLINTQSATTYTIGFGPDVGGSTLLQNTASGAGG